MHDFIHLLTTHLPLNFNDYVRIWMKTHTRIIQNKFISISLKTRSFFITYWKKIKNLMFEYKRYIMHNFIHLLTTYLPLNFNVYNKIWMKTYTIIVQKKSISISLKNSFVFITHCKEIKNFEFDHIKLTISSIHWPRTCRLTLTDTLKLEWERIPQYY